MEKIVVDIWGGEHSAVWLARFLRPIDEALQIARIELSKGYLVNLRAEIEFGEDCEFDDRRLN